MFCMQLWNVSNYTSLYTRHNGGIYIYIYILRELATTSVYPCSPMRCYVCFPPRCFINIDAVFYDARKWGCLLFIYSNYFITLTSLRSRLVSATPRLYFVAEIIRVKQNYGLAKRLLTCSWMHNMTANSE